MALYCPFDLFAYFTQIFDDLETLSIIRLITEYCLHICSITISKNSKWSMSIVRNIKCKQIILPIQLICNYHVDAKI